MHVIYSVFLFGKPADYQREILYDGDDERVALDWL